MTALQDALERIDQLEKEKAELEKELEEIEIGKEVDYPSVGHVSVFEEFLLDGRTFTRCPSLVEYLPYDIILLPDARTGWPRRGHQNCVIVQAKETGALFYAETWYRVKRNETGS